MNEILKSDCLTIALTACVGIFSFGCGAGTAAIAGGGGGGGESTVAPQLSSATLIMPADADARSSPVKIQLIVSGDANATANVDLVYFNPGNATPIPVQLSAGTLANLATRAEPYQLTWDFSAQLAEGDGLNPGVRLFASVPGGVSSVVPGVNDFVRSFGNDPPQLDELTPGVLVEVPVGKTSGNALVRFRVSDSSRDEVNADVEFRVVNGETSASWTPATPAGDPGDTIVAEVAGTTVNFFWDTIADFGTNDNEVEVRVRVDDLAVDANGAPTGIFESGPSLPFRVDNNQAPIALLSGSDFVLNPDQRLGIPIPIDILDPEGDSIDLVVQWRLGNEGFPSLTKANGTALNRIELLAAMKDSRERKRLQIATEFPSIVRGRFGFGTESSAPESVVLQSLGGVNLSLTADKLVGRELELLRRDPLESGMLTSAAIAGLRFPVAAIAIDGQRILVLHEPTNGSWQLAEVDVANGILKNSFAEVQTGKPASMALEPNGESVIVAAGMFNLHRVDLHTGFTEQIFEAAGSSAPISPVRGLAVLSDASALVTTDDSLVQISYSDPNVATASVLAGGLSVPRGIAIHPDGRRVFIAEFGAERLSLYDLVTRTLREKSVMLTDNFGTPISPANLAGIAGLQLTPDGKRLYLNVDRFSGDGQSDLTVINLSGALAPKVEELTLSLPETCESLSIGPNGLIVSPEAGTDKISLGGGIAEARTILAWDPNSSTAQLETPFSATSLLGRNWRTNGFGSVRPSPAGSRRVFVWDSRDVPFGNTVAIRALPLDGEIGVGSGSNAPRMISGLFNSDAELLPLPLPLIPGIGTEKIFAMASGDFTNDLVSDVAVLVQDSSKLFIFEYSQLQGALIGQAFLQPTRIVDSPFPSPSQRLVAEDFNGDGLVDLLSGGQLVLQTTPPGQGTQFSGPFPVGGLQGIGAIADINQDGFLDFVGPGPIGFDIQFLSAGASPFTVNSSITSIEAPGEPQAVRITDINQDSLPDLVTVVGLFLPDGSFDLSVNIYLQDQTGSFPSSPTFSIGDLPSDPSFALPA